MLVYYLNLFLIFALGILLCVFRPSKVKNIIYLVITFGYMWFLATFRNGIGFDYNAYIKIFNEIKNTGGLLAVLQLPYEWGFSILTKGISLFVTSPVVLYGVYAAIIFIPIAVFIYRYCKDVWLSTWLYVTLTFFYTSMNFIRQSIACSIIVLGYGFLKNKKPVPFIAIVLLAATFHKTALIMIPVYFLSHLKLTKITSIVYASTAFVLYLTSGWILNFFTTYYFTYYKGSVYIEAGFPLVFLLVPFVIFAGCLALKIIWERRDSDSTILLNLMMFNAIIWLFITKHFILERFSMYIYIFVLVALPSALRSLRSSPEECEQYNTLKLEYQNTAKNNKTKGQTARMRELGQNISDHQKYYWCAVFAALLLTFLYNDFGANVNGFHNVFPYVSVFDFITNLP